MGGQFSEQCCKSFIESGTIFTLDHAHLLVGYGPRTWADGPGTLGQPYFYSPDFFLMQPKPWFTHAHHVVISTATLISALEPFARA